MPDIHGGHEPKRHHQVPRAYLERFAIDGKVRVRRRDGRAAFETSPLNVAVESGYYDVTGFDGRRTSAVEGALGEIESPAWPALAAVDRTGRPPQGKDREALAEFIAIQMTRTTHYRDRALFPKTVEDWAAGRPIDRDLIREYLRIEHIGEEPSDREVEGAWVFVTTHMADTTIVTEKWALEMMFTGAVDLLDRLSGLHWMIEVDPRRGFVTSDQPVIPWRKVSRRDHYHGIGIETAGELRFPLDPAKQLVLSRRRRRPVITVNDLRVRRANADMAEWCHRFVVGSPANRRGIDGLHLDPWRPVIRFNVGRLEVRQTDGELVRQDGEVVQMWVPRGARFGKRSAQG